MSWKLSLHQHSGFYLQPGNRDHYGSQPHKYRGQAPRCFCRRRCQPVIDGDPVADDNALVALGREHGRDEALAALATARSVFARVSADFIYCRPGQDSDHRQAELASILDLGLDHLSLYQLTLEPGRRSTAAISAGCSPCLMMTPGAGSMM